EGVHRLGDSLVSIIGDFLDFTKIEARRIELETTAFAPRAVVEETVELLAGPAQRKGVEVAYRVDPAVPRALRGDPGRLRQVLLNLVGNALKFTAHGEVAVRVGVVDQTAKTVTLRFEVADTGIGIGREKQACIFEPFAQANRSTTREYGGARRPERAAAPARRARGRRPLRPRLARCRHAGLGRPPARPRHPHGAGALSDAARPAVRDRREGPASAGRGRHAHEAGAGGAAGGVPGQRRGASLTPRHPPAQRRIVSTKITASSRIMTAMKKPE